MEEETGAHTVPKLQGAVGRCFSVLSQIEGGATTNAFSRERRKRSIRG